MKNIRFLIITLTLLLTPVAFLFAQDAPTEEPKTGDLTSFTFLQGASTMDEGSLVWFEAMRDRLYDSGTLFVDDAAAIAAIFMIIFFAIKSYEMMSGDKQLEIMPLLRPFGLIMILLYWLPFCTVVKLPTDVIASTTKASWMNSQTKVDNLRLTRAKLMMKLVDALYEQKVETEVASKETDGWWDTAKEWTSNALEEGVNTVVRPILEMKERFAISIQLFMTQALEILAVWLLRFGVSLLMMIQLIYSNVLVILGPFAVGASVLPAFRDSFTTWIARFISVNLYVGIAYLVMFICCELQEATMQMEIDKYTAIFVGGTDQAKLAALAANGLFSFGLVIVSFIVSAIAMTTVPSISTWIISTSGISSAASAAGRNSQVAGGMAGKLLSGGK